MSKIRQPSKNDSFLDVNDLRTGVNFIQAKSKLSQQQLEEKFASSGRIEIDGGLSISYDNIEYSLDKRTGDTIITFKKSVNIKAPINGSTTAPLDFDISSKKKKTVFNEDNSIDTITDNEKLTTVFNEDGSITETYESVNGAKYKKTTVFNEDGSIDENVETISEANNINIDENFYRVNGYEIVDLDGKPFHMVAIKRSLTSNYLSEEKLNKLFQEISEDGFNTLVTSFLPKRDIIYYPNIFKYAEKYGVKLVVELYYYESLLKDDEAMRLNLEQIRNNRNVIMVSIYDAYSQEEIAAAITKIRETDVHHTIMVKARNGYEYEDKNLVFYDGNSDRSFVDFIHGYENVSYYDFIVSEMDEKTKSSNTSKIETINKHRSTWTHAVSSPVFCEDRKVYSGIVAFTLQNYSEGTEIKFRNLKVYDVATGETISNFDFNKAYCYNAEKIIDSDGSLKVIANGTGDITVYMGDVSVTNPNGTFRAQVGKNYRIEFDYCDNDSIKDPQVTINYLTKFIGFNYIFPLRDYFEYYFSEIINRMKTLNVPIIPSNINCDFDVMMERGEDFFWDITKAMYSTGANVIYDVYNELMYNTDIINQGLYTIIFNALHQSTKYTRVFLDEESAIAGSADENSYIIGITSKEAVPIVKNVVINDNAASTKSTYSSSKIENVIKDISKKLINNEEISSAISQKVSDEIDKNLGSLIDRLNTINNGTTPIIGSGINIIRKSKAEYDALSESEKNNGSLYYVYDEDEVLNNGESFIKELTSAQYEALTNSEKQANVLYLVGNDLYFKDKVLNGNSENDGEIVLSFTKEDFDVSHINNEIPEEIMYLKYIPFDKIHHDKYIDFLPIKLQIAMGESSMGAILANVSYDIKLLYLNESKAHDEKITERSEVEESLSDFENELGYDFNKYLKVFVGENFDYAYVMNGGRISITLEPGDALTKFIIENTQDEGNDHNKIQLKGMTLKFLDENKNLIKEVPFLMPDDNDNYSHEVTILTSDNCKEYIMAEIQNNDSNGFFQVFEIENMGNYSWSLLSKLVERFGMKEKDAKFRGDKISRYLIIKNGEDIYNVNYEYKYYGEDGAFDLELTEEIKRRLFEEETDAFYGFSFESYMREFFPNVINYSEADTLRYFAEVKLTIVKNSEVTTKEYEYTKFLKDGTSLGEIFITMKDEDGGLPINVAHSDNFGVVRRDKNYSKPISAYEFSHDTYNFGADGSIQGVALKTGRAIKRNYSTSILNALSFYDRIMYGLSSLYADHQAMIHLLQNCTIEKYSDSINMENSSFDRMDKYPNRDDYYIYCTIASNANTIGVIAGCVSQRRLETYGNDYDEYYNRVAFREYEGDVIDAPETVVNSFAPSFNGNRETYALKSEIMGANSSHDIAYIQIPEDITPGYYRFFVCPCLTNNILGLQSQDWLEATSYEVNKLVEKYLKGRPLWDTKYRWLGKKPND